MAVKKILIVDDSATERLVLVSLLESKGYTIVTATNGEEAITTAQRELPDLILMDVVMPGMNGYQATRTISREPTTKHIPVILCTTKDQETDKIWGMRQGALDYMVKPVDQAALLAKLATL